MKLQYVFGNPTGKTKKRKKAKKAKKVKKNKMNGSRKVAKKKTKKKKNPQKTTVKAFAINKVKTKTGKTIKRKGKLANKHTSASYATSGELHRMRASLSVARALIAEARQAKSKAKGPKRKIYASFIKKLQKQLASATKAYKTKAVNASKEHAGLRAIIANWKQEEAIIKTETTYSGQKGAKVAKKKRKKKATKKKTRRKKKKTSVATAAPKKKKRKKKKSTKKSKAKKAKRSKSVSAAPKKRRKKRKSTKKKKSSSRKRRSSKRRSIGLKKGQSVTVKANPKSKRRGRRKKNPFFGGIIMKKSNPMKVAGMQVAGYDPMELAELATGGLFYGAANSYISPLFAKIPGLGGMAGMLGGTIPSLIAGIGLNILSEKISNPQAKKAAEFVGDGLLGAAVVGLGVHLSQTLLPASMSGVDYIQATPGIDPDFSGVDYTPDGGYMSGIDFTPGMSLPGQNPGVDFGGVPEGLGKYAYEQDVADFGGVPEGMQGMG